MMMTDVRCSIIFPPPERLRTNMRLIYVFIRPEEHGSPSKQGLVMFCSFIAFGVIPLVPYVAFMPISNARADTIFIIVLVMVAVALFSLGAISARWSGLQPYKGGLFMLVNGSLSAGVAYLIGFIMQEIVHVKC